MSDSKSTEEQQVITDFLADDVAYLVYGNSFNNLLPEQRARLMFGTVELAEKIVRYAAKRVEEAHNKHRSTLRIIEQYIDRIPEMYAKELLHRMRAFGVEISSKEVDKDKLDEFLDKTLAALNNKTPDKEEL